MLPIVFLIAPLALTFSVASGAQPAPAKPIQSGYCSALLPNGWSGSSNPQASAFDAYAPDRRAYAGWGVVPINTAMRAYYGPLYGPPEESILFLANQAATTVGLQPLRYAGAPGSLLGFYTTRRLEGPDGHGVVFFRVYPTGPSTYIEAVYLALAAKGAGQTALDSAMAAATSIRCTTQLLPSESTAPSSSKGAAGTRGKKACPTDNPLRGYNRELGVQWFHDSLGNNHWISNSTPETNGPDGKGHYRPGSTLPEKLKPGRADDC